MKKYHNIEQIAFKGEKMVLKVGGKEYYFQLSDIFPKLAQASYAEREKYEISPSGYGIHWPLINEDISVNGLLGIKHSPRQITKKVPVYSGREK